MFLGPNLKASNIFPFFWKGVKDISTVNFYFALLVPLHSWTFIPLACYKDRQERMLAVISELPPGLNLVQCSHSGDFELSMLIGIQNNFL